MTPIRRRDGDGTGGLLQRSATYAELRERAVALRREGLSLWQIRDRLKVHNNDLLNRAVQGEPPPAWTRRPNAKDGLRARELRLEGKTYDRIQLGLGVSKSSISLWVRDLPKPERRRTPAEQAMLASRKRWEFEGARREVERQQNTSAARQEIGDMTERELFLLGVGLYWAEGAKSKPYHRRETVSFVNSDPGMIQLYLAWLTVLGIEPARWVFRVMIHENADVAAAERYWADLAGIEVSALAKTTLKRHNPKTTRKNTGADYRGCLVVNVRRGADLYQRIEGWWAGIVAEAAPRSRPSGSGRV